MSNKSTAEVVKVIIERKWFVIAVLIFIQVMFGVNFPASKVIVDEMDPVLWSNLRFFLAGLGMLVMTIMFRRVHPPFTKEFFLPVSLLSILGMALGQGLFLIGLRFTTAVNSSILITFIPILTLLIVIIRKQEEVSLNKLAGIALAFLGVIFMRNISQFTLSNETFLGDLLVLAGALCFAMYLSFGKSFFMKFDNMWSTTWMFFISGFAMGLFNFNKFSSLMSIDYTPVFISCAAFSIIGATLLTYLLNNWALRRAPSGNIAVFIYLQPVVAGLLGYFFLGENITLRMVLCGFLIMLGLVLTLLKFKKSRTANISK